MAPRHQAMRFFAGVAVIAVVLLLPFWIGQAQFALNDTMFDPDMFTLYGLARDYDPTLFRHDYTADYYLSQWMPLGYRLLYGLWSYAFDPRLLERILPIVLWFSCWFPVYVAGKALGGRVNGAATLGIYACSSIFNFRMVGGMAHGFGFPLTWWVVAALLSGSPVSLAMAMIAAAAFYPIIAPVAAITLGIFVMFPFAAPAVPRHAAWLRLAWGWRLAGLALPALLAFGLMASMVMPHTGYGPIINVHTQQAEFPEAVNALAVINPFAYSIIAYSLQNSTRLGMEGGQLLTLGIFGLLFASILLHDARDKRPGNLKPYIIAVAVCFLGSLLLMQEHSYRFAIYNFPVLITLYLPLCLRSISRFLPRNMRSLGFVFFVLGYIGLVAKADATASGYLFILEPFQQRANNFIATLPKDAVLAGWPGDRFGRVVESVPYVAQRSVLVTWAGHPIVHTDYVLTMRARMNALVDAYLAEDVGAIRDLRDRFKVDYLVVNRHDFEGDTAPAYIEPFTSRAEALWTAHKGHFVAIRLDSQAGIYTDGDISILDLKKL